MTLVDGVKALAAAIAVDVRALQRNIKQSTSLTYAATRSVNAAAAPRQVIVLSGNMTVSAPTSPADGQDMRLEFVATGAGPWTVTLTTGAAGAFAYGTDLTALPTVATGKTLYVLVTYNATAQRWRVLSAVGGF
jgi:hypothetical protein